MKAVFRHELTSYFTGLTGYVFGAFLLLFAGIYTMVYNIQAALAHFEYVLSGMSFVFLVAIPVLTMRVISEERRQKTDQLLYSLPLSMTQVVLGKYAAMAVVMLLPIAIICVYPLVLSGFGSLYLPAAYSAIGGFLFLGLALLAIGMYVSSVTESQAVAAGLCFVVMLVNYIIADLSTYVSATAFASLAAFMVLALAVCAVVWLMTKNGLLALVLAAASEAGLVIVYTVNSTAFEGLFPQLMESLSLFEQFYSLLNGIFDLRSVVYLCSVAVFFLFLTVQSLEKRRWSE